MSGRRWTIALGAWTVLVWTTRIVNIAGDEALTGMQKAGRTLLALSFTALVVAVGYALAQRRRWLDDAVRSLAFWTIGVWIVRALGIVSGDHDAAFVLVHLLLAAVSVGLGLAAIGEEDRAGPAEP